MTALGPVWAVVVAAGSGARFGGAKQFAELGGRPLVSWSVDAARTVADGIVVVVPAGHDGAVPGADRTVHGGATRSASVRAGLAAVPADAAVVVVHDAARPLASPSLFEAVVGALDRHDVAGAICAVPVHDTIKRVADGEVTETLERADLVAVQTPQAFRADALRRAHAGAGDATDDAALVEALGATVRVVPGDPRNMKVTTPADLVVARRLLEA